MASKTTQITLITLQFGILLLQTGSVALQLRSAVPGLLVALLWLACMALGLWALSANRPGNFNIRPEPKTDGQLVQTGPYRWIRHPMYTAVLLFSIGCAGFVATLLAGGLSYTAGTYFYMHKRIPFAHAIWHGFVLGGSACHFVAVTQHVVPS